MVKTWIDRVFVDGQHIAGGMPVRDLGKTKAFWKGCANRVLEDTGADHVIYCHIEYNDEGEVTTARFYPGIKMDDTEFYKVTGGLTGDFFVGAVHKLQ